MEFFLFFEKNNYIIVILAEGHKMFCLDQFPLTIFYFVVFPRINFGNPSLTRNIRDVQVISVPLTRANSLRSTVVSKICKT